MAENTNQQDTSSKVKFYKTRIAGLTVQIGKAPSDEEMAAGRVSPPVVAFEPYEEKYQGDKVVVGYLSTSSLIAIKKLASDPNVIEISEEEYKKATDIEKGARKAAV